MDCCRRFIYFSGQGLIKGMRKADITIKQNIDKVRQAKRNGRPTPQAGGYLKRRYITWENFALTNT